MAELRIGVKTITKLTDAASELFRVLYALEKKYQAVAKKQQQRRSVFLDMDVFRNDTIEGEPELWQSS